MWPESIVLRRLEAQDALAAVDGAQVVLVDTDYLVVLLELEETSTVLLDWLYPEA
ncbi:MAG: hypothetical protein ACRD29_17950 [Acidimicrobiales bacterium]